MADIDLRTLALRLKVVEMLRIYTERRKMDDPVSVWRRWLGPN
jgi:hypothetical protein